MGARPQASDEGRGMRRARTWWILLFCLSLVCAGGASASVTEAEAQGTNAPPVAKDNEHRVMKGGTLKIPSPGVLRNDLDPDGDQLTAARVSSPRHGRLTLRGGGSYVYKPDEGYRGKDSFTYRATDPSGASDTATVEITVWSPDRLPLARNNVYAVGEDGTLTVPAPGVLKNDAEADGRRLSATKVTDPGHGGLSLNRDGSFAYTPEKDFSGEDSFVYRATDNRGRNDEGTVTIAVGAVNDAPVFTGAAANTSQTIDEGADMAALEATDADGDTLTFELTGGSLPPGITLGGDGRFAGAAGGRAAGSYTANIKVSDGDGETDTTDLAVTVNPVEEASLVDDSDVATDEDVAKTITLTATDADTDSLTFSVGEPGHGSLGTASAPDCATSAGTTTCTATVLYTPDADFNGPDSFTYTAGDSAPATVSITVNPVNDAPAVAFDNTPSGADEGETKTFAFDVTDPDAGDSFTVNGAAGFPDCGTGGTQAGQTSTNAGGGSFECRFPDGPASPNVRVQVTDSQDVDSSVAEQPVAVANVKPSISLSGPNEANEGETKTYDFTVTDPGDDTHTTTAVCGDDGDKVQNSDQYDQQTKTGSFRCLFPEGPATTNVTAAATDSDGAADTDGRRVEVTVDNVPPTATLGNDGPKDEGSPVTVSFTDQNDPSGADAGAGFRYAYNCDGSEFGTVRNYADLAGSAASTTCTYDDGEHTVRALIMDRDGDYTEYTTTFQVNNVAPTADAQSIQSDEDETKLITLTGDDVAADEPLTFKVASLPANGKLYEGNGTAVADEISTVPATLTGDRVTYEPDANYNGSDSFTYTTNDGTVDSSTATVSIQVASINDSPAVETESGSAPYTEAGDAAEVSPLLTVDDPDTANLTGATVSITTGRLSGDTLSFDTQNGITGNYDSGTGVLTLSGPSSVENYQTALRSVRYSSTSNAPGTSRTVSFQVNDGEAANNLSNTATRDVSITEVNSRPEVTTSSGATPFTENDPAVAVDNALTVADSDSGNLVGATVEITSGYASGEDDLLFTDQNGITGSVSGDTLTLSGTSSVPNYQTALRSVKYNNTSDTPNTDQRTVSFQVNDGSSVSNLSTTATKNVSVAAANDVPRIDLNGDGAGTGHSATFTEDGQAVSIVDSANLTVTDADDTNIESATVTITNLQNGSSESLNADVGTTGITKSYDSGVLTLGTSATKAQYQQVLRTVTYNNTSQNPGVTGRDVTFVVDDGDDDSNTATSDVGVNGVNDAPALTLPASVTAPEDEVTALTGISASDVDAGSGNVTLTLSVPSGTLSATSGGGVAVSGSGSGSLTLTGAVANIDTFIAGSNVTFKTAQNADQDVTLTAAINDGGNTGSGGPGADSGTVIIDVLPVNDAPVAGTDSWETFGNTELRVDLTTSPSTPHISDTTTNSNGTLQNDNDPVENDSVSVAGIAGCSDDTSPYDCTVSGAKVLMRSDGTFSYTPAPGASSGTFQYTLKDSGGRANGGDDDATGTVNLTLHEKIWYVDPNAGSGGSGTSNSPLSSFGTTLNGPGGSGDSDVANDYIFVYDGTLNGSVELEAGQHLLGEGVGLTINRNLNGNGAPTNLVGQGIKPQINGSGDAVKATQAMPAEIRGLSLSGGASANAIDLTATGSYGGSSTLTISDNTVTAAGAEGMDMNLGATGTAAMAIHDNTVTSTGTALDVRRTAGTAFITRFDDNAVSGDTGGPYGVYVEGVTFDATPGGSFDAVGGGTTTVGASGNAVGGHGVLLGGVSGDLRFDDLDVVASAGNGLFVQGTGQFGGSSGMRVGVKAPADGGSSTITATGGAAVSTTSLTLDLRLETAKSTNGIGTGLGLGNATGTFSAGSSSEIINAGAADVRIDSSPVAFSYAGTITDDQGRLVEVINTTASGSGDKTFSGAITDGNDGDGSGILLDNNDAATVDFTGGLTLSTGTNDAFTAKNGGTVNVTGANNTIAAVGGTALKVENTNIGSNNLNFKSISANGGANGIVLNNTGTGGGLSVTGSGGVCTGSDQSGCSGGRIQNTTGGDDTSNVPAGAGIVLNDTRGVSLTRMHIHNHSNYGIRGATVNGFTLANSVINGTNGTNSSGGLNESSVLFDHHSGSGPALTGSASVTDTYITGGYANQFWVSNDSGSLNRLTFDRVEAGSQNNRNDTIQVEGLGSSTTNVTVKNSLFTGTAGDHFQYIANGSGGGDLDYDSNTHTNNHPLIATGGGYVTISGGGGAGKATVDIHGANTFRDGLTNAITLTKSFGPGDMDARITGATIGVAGVANSGSLEGSGISFTHAGGGADSDMKLTITNNTIREYNNYGIFLQAGAGIATGGHLDATVTGNTVANPGTNSSVGNIFQGISLNNGVTPKGVNGDTTNGDSFQTCLHLSGNNATNSGRNGGHDIRLRQRMNTTVRLPGYAGGASDTGAVSTFLLGQNTAATASATRESSNVPSGGGFVGGGDPCAQ